MCHSSERNLLVKAQSDYQKRLGAVPGHTDLLHALHNPTGGGCISLGKFCFNVTENLVFQLFSGLLSKEGSAMEITYL